MQSFGELFVSKKVTSYSAKPDSLDILPDEILLMIFSYLKSPLILNKRYTKLINEALRINLVNQMKRYDQATLEFRLKSKKDAQAILKDMLGFLQTVVVTDTLENQQQKIYQTLMMLMEILARINLQYDNNKDRYLLDGGKNNEWVRTSKGSYQREVQVFNALTLEDIAKTQKLWNDVLVCNIPYQTSRFLYDLSLKLAQSINSKRKLLLLSVLFKNDVVDDLAYGVCKKIMLILEQQKFEKNHVARNSRPGVQTQ